MKNAILPTLPVLLMLACASDPATSSDKGDESDVPVDGSFDSFYDPTVHELVLGTPADAELARGARFHAFDFSLSGDAHVVLRTTADDPYTDTVAYLYRAGDRGWGRYVARNDDAPGLGLFSRVEMDLGEGDYRLLVKGYGWWVEGPFTVESSCEGAGCGEVEPGVCLFGGTYHDFLNDPRFETVSSGRYTDVSRLPAVQQAQLLAAVRVTYDVADLEEALATIDAGEANLLVREYRGASYTSWEFGAGDNSYGALFETGSTVIVARILDGDLYECTVFAPELGGEGDDCERDTCAEGLVCQGFVTEVGAGKCVSTARVEGEGDECGGSVSCGEGLVCAGSSLDPSWGLCNPAWMRGSFAAEGLPVAIEDEATTEHVLYAYGLATVSTDVVLSARIEHSYPGDLLVTLTNPTGTEAPVFDGETDEFDSETLVLEAPIAGFPGDEDVNGAWTLRIVDRVARDAGTLEHFELELTSRWD